MSVRKFLGRDLDFWDGAIVVGVTACCLGANPLLAAFNEPAKDYIYNDLEKGQFAFLLGEGESCRELIKGIPEDNKRLSVVWDKKEEATFIIVQEYKEPKGFLRSDSNCFVIQDKIIDILAFTPMDGAGFYYDEKYGEGFMREAKNRSDAFRRENGFPIKNYSLGSN